MTETTQGSQGSVFISYSRKDKAFVQKLNDGLDNIGVQAWVDWEGIELASDWMETISTAIKDHDAFIFVISPDSLKSKVCLEELELGLKFNKKLIPILYREPTKTSKMHEKLAATNWVYLRNQDDFDATLPKLVESIQTDLEWVSQNTQLLGQAMEWESRNKNNSFLLGGTKLQDAEHWMADASGKENRAILPLQAEYISTSRTIATRNQRRLTITMSLLVIAAIVFGIFALLSRERAQQAEQEAKASEATAVANEHIAATQKAIAEENQKKAEESQKVAEDKTRLANAERSAAQAQILQTRAGQLDTSTLLAIRSYEGNPSFQAENLIRINSSLLAIPVEQMSQDGAIWNIEWSPDYEYFVTGNNLDSAKENAVGKACVYHSPDGTVAYCVSHDSDINDAIFSKDGKYLITASADKTVKFWDASNGDPVNIEGLEFGGSVLDLDVSDSVLAIAREDNFLTLYYFDKTDIAPVHVGQADGVRSVEFSPSGDFLAFGLQNGQVKFWQAKNNFFFNGVKHPRSSYVVLAWSPDSLWLASGGGDSTARLAKRDGTPQHEVSHQDWVEGVAFGPDPSWYATASDDNKIRVIETATGAEKFRMSHTHFAQRVIVSSDGQWIASTGYDQVVRIWDSVSGNQMLEIPLEANGSAISFSEKADEIVVADENGNVSIWDISILKTRTGFIEFTEFVRETHFTPSGEYLIVNADDYNVWRIPAEQVSQFTDGTEGDVILTANSLTYDTAISPDSNWVAVVELDTEDTQKNRGTLVSIDGTTQYPLEHGGEVTGVAFTNDSQLVATAGTDGVIWFWDMTGEKQQVSLDNSEPVFSIATSPTNSLLFAGLHNKIKIWNTNINKQVAEIQQTGDINTIAVNSDGTLLATGSTENMITLWNVASDGTLTQYKDLLQLNGIPRALAFSPDNRWLAGGGFSGFAYLWDLDSGQELARIPHGANSVTSVSFSLDSAQLLTVSRKVVRIWDISAIPKIPKDELITTACSHLIENLSQDDWTVYFVGEDYQAICQELSLPEEK
ncbi:MAG TPA: TIR domain-containing protein [Anaerolineales bacterium]|nr:TIR domain-containing protein [Anaerolineales bacterium]